MSRRIPVPEKTALWGKKGAYVFSANCSTTIPSAKHLNIDIGGLYPKLSETLKDSD